MPSLKAIRKRIASVKSTQKITRATKMVAAARLRRAQQRITELRPFAIKTAEVLRNVAARVEGADATHALLARREEKQVLVLVVSSDRGLAGAFNSNVNRACERKMRELQNEGKRVALVTIGRKARDYFRRRGAEIVKEIPGIHEKIDIARADEIAGEIIDLYVGEPASTQHDDDHAHGDNGERAGQHESAPDALPQFDAVYVIYNEFKSAMTQLTRIDRLLPIAEPTEEEADAHADSQTDGGLDYLYEPSRHAILDALLPMYVQVTIYRVLLESVASEFGAKMTAMDAATNNAKEMISKFTLDYNRARQAAITKELMEIISGAEALK